MNLRELEIGKAAVVTSVGGDGALRQHLLDMGIIPGVEVVIVKYAPRGDPMEVRIHGYELTLRLADAEKIEVVPASEYAPEQEKGLRKQIISLKAKQVQEEADKGLPDGEKLTFALMGNQNCGKTTLFNQLTGSKQHVGNFPGVTVEKKDGEIIGHPGTVITDLPGIYSMSPYTSEELVSRDFLLNEKPKGIINIVDATNIDRNLYLTMQLLEMDVPMVVALNMMDEVVENGGSVDVKGMEAVLGVPVIPISAMKNQGVQELIERAIHTAKCKARPSGLQYDYVTDRMRPVSRCMQVVAYLMEDRSKETGLPSRFAAGKMIEGDERIIGQLNYNGEEQEIFEGIIRKMEQERGLDRSAAIADYRFSYIRKICDKYVVKPKESKEHEKSMAIDRILTGKYTAIPVFIGIMALVFYLTFNVIGAGLQGLLATGIEALTHAADQALTNAQINEALHGLIINGVFEGVGSVLSFLPIIVTMFFFLSLMEDSGYIARVAFVLDMALRKLGLSGRSSVPLLIGFGCSVPAIMSTRTLPSERDRKMTILLTPFMSCTAKLPIYAFFVDVFFPRHKALIMVSLYVGGIVIGILAAFLYKKVMFKGEAVPFVMELPNYRIPSPKSVARLLWQKAKDFIQKAKDFIQKAFTVILIASIIIWVLKSFDFHFNFVTNSEDSILAAFSGLIAPIFRPMGLGDWRIVTSLFSGVMAKESVVSVMEVLFKAEGGAAAVITPLASIAMLVFCLLYTPCVAAIAAIRRELGRKWAAGIVVWQCVLAWIFAYLVYLVGGLFIR
ncbi:MAG: ferrous iron transport protein B [Clostridia bacterium]|nr:ferrous iron transport protein B [Clostridia bacterium]